MSQNETFQMEQGDRFLPSTGRPVIHGANGVVSTGHVLTSMAGMRMLLSGGNAFDAAVASVFAAAVVEPVSSFSLGSECVGIFHDAATGEDWSLCGQGGAVLAATPDFYLSKGFDCIPTGPGAAAPLSFTTPGMVGAMLSLLESRGTKSVAEVLEPALSYARQGIPNYEYMLSRLDDQALLQFKRFPPGGLGVFFDDDKVPQPGTMLVQSALGHVLDLISSAGSSASRSRSENIAAARQCFYSGEVGRMIAAASAKVGGILKAADLAMFSERYETPTASSFGEFTVHGQSFWSQAPVMLQALNILETFDLVAMGHNSAAYIHTITEALKLAFADREAYYADPDFTDLRQDALLDKAYAEKRATLIDPDATYPGLPPAGNPWDRPDQAAESLGWPFTLAPQLGVESGTTHVSVADRAGNLVAITPSGGAFIKSVYFEELGFALSTRSEMLNLSVSHPNCVAPYKRPRTSLASYMVSRKGTPFVTIGCPGGDAQVQGALQILLNSLVWGMNPQESVERARFATMSVPNSFYPHTYLKGQLALEAGIDEGVAASLRAKGHKTARVATCGMGATVTVRNASGIMSTGADPRRSSYALAF